MKKIKSVVIREDYVLITGDFRKALILGQFLYWTEKARDVDKVIEEHNQRRTVSGEEPIPYCEGWIYKSAKELRVELMLDCSEEKIRKEVSLLKDMGYLITRSNPLYGFDRTIQYRVDFLFLCRKLKEIGFGLDGYYFSELGAHPEIDAIPHCVGSRPRYVEAIPEITGSEIKEKEKKGLFHPLYPYPKTVEEMQEILEFHGIEYNPNHGDKFFFEMEACDWIVKGQRVFDWISLYQARLNFIDEQNSW